jgi:hypothetical protein
MIRIITADGPETTKLTVEGTLSPESIETVQACCAQALSRGKAVRLWLHDVAPIGELGRTVLQRLAAAGVDLAADGVYNASIIDEIRSAPPKVRPRCR